MRYLGFYASFLLTVALTASAHFQLQFPPPRGPFVEDKEPSFCDGYTNVTTNRTQFPLSGGFWTLNSEHPQWSAGVFVSTDDDPTSFDDFSQVNTFFQLQGAGQFCIPLDFSKSNATNLAAGQNISIQILYDGGDGPLYQCADLTLSDSVNLSSQTCQNGTSGSGSQTATSPGSSPTTGGALTTTAALSPITISLLLLLPVVGVSLIA